MLANHAGGFIDVDAIFMNLDDIFCAVEFCNHGAILTERVGRRMDVDTIFRDVGTFLRGVFFAVAACLVSRNARK